MAYTQFSSEKADYVLDLGNHFHNRRNDEIFDGINALILESGNIHPNEILNNGSTLGNKRLIEYCEEQEIPIYFVDCPITATGALREMLGSIPEVPVMPIELYYSLSKRKVNGLLGKVCSTYTYLLQNPIVEGRNAIVARKIEEFLVPDLHSKLGRKPRIGIHHGAGHIGLREDIQSEKRRNFTIWNYRNFNFRRFASFDVNSMNQLYLCKHDGSRWTIYEKTTDLFNL